MENTCEILVFSSNTLRTFVPKCVQNEKGRHGVRTRSVYAQSTQGALLLSRAFDAQSINMLRCRDEQEALFTHPLLLLMQTVLMGKWQCVQIDGNKVMEPWSRRHCPTITLLTKHNPSFKAPDVRVPAKPSAWVWQTLAHHHHHHHNAFNYLNSMFPLHFTLGLRQ